MSETATLTADGASTIVREADLDFGSGTIDPDPKLDFQFAPECDWPDCHELPRRAMRKRCCQNTSLVCIVHAVDLGTANRSGTACAHCRQTMNAPVWEAVLTINGSV